MDTHKNVILGWLMGIWMPFFFPLGLSVVSKLFASTIVLIKMKKDILKMLKGCKDYHLLESALGKEIKQVGVMCSAQEES